MPMSETPTLPISDEKTNRYEVPTGQAFEARRIGEFQVPRFELAETFDLDSDELPNGELWTQEELDTPAQAIERIEEARRPQTRAQEVEESLFYLDDKQLLAYAIANTKAVWALKHLA
ncbi:MAG TPA: hypothetical protein PLN95_01285 [Candidatus Saccharibacteria bacterium]|nr:hypothetical protein [Candidatus Saccharibacteria bacterium]